jgi:hypothetical protein
LALGIRRRDPLRLVTASVFSAVFLRMIIPPTWDRILFHGIPLHALGIELLLIGALFEGNSARLIRRTAAALILVATVLASALPGLAATTWPTWIVPVYLTVLLAIGFLYAWVTWDWYVFSISGANATVALCILGAQYADYLQRTTGWSGAGSFLMGLGWFLLALVISATKAELPQRWLGRITSRV